jgi:hypothetical protein
LPIRVGGPVERGDDVGGVLRRSDQSSGQWLVVRDQVETQVGRAECSVHSEGLPRQTLHYYIFRSDLALSALPIALGTPRPSPVAAPLSPLTPAGKLPLPCPFYTAAAEVPRRMRIAGIFAESGSIDFLDSSGCQADVR